MSNKQWSDTQITQHKIAADLCCAVMDETFEFIRQNSGVTEYEVQQFILLRFYDKGLVTDTDPPIVAFRENTSFVHYFPEKTTSKKLTNNSLIMIDLWARLNEKNAPFTDITWMAWHGSKIPDDIQKGFDITLNLRDNCINLIQKCLDVGETIRNKDLFKSMTDVTILSRNQDLVLVAYGHSVGLTSSHGRYGIFLENSRSSVRNNVAYTIEPMCVDKNYGFRSEINFYISNDKELHITTAVQKELMRV